MPNSRQSDRPDGTPRRRRDAAPAAGRSSQTAEQVSYQAALVALSRSRQTNIGVNGYTSRRDDHRGIAHYQATFSAADARDVYNAQLQRSPRTLPVGTASSRQPVTANAARYAEVHLVPQTVEQYYGGPERHEAYTRPADDSDDTDDDSDDDSEDSDEEEEDLLADIDSPVYGRVDGVQQSHYNPQALEAAGMQYYQAQAQTFHLAPSQTAQYTQSQEPYASYQLSPHATAPRPTARPFARPARSDPRFPQGPSSRRPPNPGAPPRDSSYQGP